MKYLIISFLLIVGLSLGAQDIHFTNFQLAPMSLNPALTGSFNGSLRASGIYRDQNSSGYNTLAGGVEFNIPFAFRKQDWIAIGAEFVQDKEKIINGRVVNLLTQTNIALAYHFAFDKKYKNILTGAIQYKNLSSKFDHTGLETYTGLLNGSTNPTLAALLPFNEDDKGKSLKDWVGALVFTSNFREKDFFKIGLSFAHIFKVDVSKLSKSSNGNIDPLPTRITTFAQGEIFINKSMSIQPTIYYQYQSPFSEFVVQSLFGIEINPMKNIKINPGLGYRFGDAIEFLFVMDYGKFKAGLSFDLTTSKYKSSEGMQNGLEFGLSYTTTIIKKPQVKPVIFCPRL